MQTNVLKTKRLILRPWRDKDYKPFADMNADIRVMEYFPKRLTAEESDTLADRIREFLAERGWGLWAVEEKSGQFFLGFVGLNVPVVDLPFNPCVEIGWRLGYEHWGKGYASEAARTALSFAFENLHLEEVVSFTSKINVRSIAVMKRIGMHDSGQDFEHPSVPDNHILRPHVLYKITKKNG